MRVYLPATVPMLRRAFGDGSFAPRGEIGFAVTADLRADYPGADTEELEYLAMHDAALASLRLIAATGSAPVRVVLAAEIEPVADHPAVVGRGDLDRAAVTVSGAVPWSSVVAVHLDGGDAAPVVQAAAAAVDAADLGDPDAAVTVGDAEDVDLGWYAPQEIGYLLVELEPR